jgi:hypothetical protein
MKKFLTIVLAAGFALSAFSANILLSPLLSGYNVLTTTNTTATGQFGAGTYAELGQSNVLFTLPNGQAVYSLVTNLYFSSTGSSTTTNALSANPVGDAFRVIKLYPDANGDYNGTTTLILYTGNTNWEPNFYWATNANGLVYLLTNTVGNYWPLATSLAPNWNYPATPTAYPTWPTSTTNAVTVNLYAGGGKPNSSGDVPASFPALFTTAPTWSVTFNVPAGIPTLWMTNIPAANLQQFREVYCSITVAPVAGQTTTTNELINFLGIMQPVP